MRNLPKPVSSIPGERITNADLSKIGLVAIHTMKVVHTKEYNDTYICGVTDQEGHQWVTFLPLGIDQRAEIAAMLAENPEPIGPVELVQVATKGGRKVWMWQGAENDLDEKTKGNLSESDDLPF